MKKALFASLAVALALSAGIASAQTASAPGRHGVAGVATSCAKSTSCSEHVREVDDARRAARAEERAARDAARGEERAAREEARGARDAARAEERAARLAARDAIREAARANRPTDDTAIHLPEGELPEAPEAPENEAAE